MIRFAHATLSVVLFSVLFAIAIQSQSDAIPDRLLTNADVIEMLHSGLTPRAVILRIHDSPCKFDKSATALEALRAADVPYKVVLAMMQAPEVPPTVNGRIPVMLPDSTPMKVELSEDLDTEAQKPGYVIYFRLLEDVRIRGLRVIAKGARVRGRLLESRDRSRTGVPAHLNWSLMDVETVDGQRIPLRGGSERTGGVLNQEKSVSANAGEQFLAFTYGSRKINVPAPIAPEGNAPTEPADSKPRERR
jgi:hypothetical protein